MSAPVLTPLSDTSQVRPSADAAYPAADLLRAVAEAYGLPAPFSTERLTGGFANDVFLLKGDRPVVLHVKHPPVDRQSMSWEHRLLELLRLHLPEIPVPLPALDGRTFLLHEERPVWLTPYAVGQVGGNHNRLAVGMLEC